MTPDGAIEHEAIDTDSVALHRIAELEQECADCESRWMIAKEETGLLKKEFESAVERLRKAIRSASETMPLFDANKTEEEPANA